MSEVDRLSNSGLYPMLPIADRRGSNGSTKEESGRKEQPATKPPATKPPDQSDTAAQPRPPKSLIDEYA